MSESRGDRQLPLPLGQLIDQRTPGHVRELWLDLGRRRSQRRRKGGLRVRTWLSIAACFLVLLGSALALSTGLDLPSSGQRPLLMAQGGALPARMQTEQRYQAFDLSDGSRITVLHGARLDVLETSPRTVALALRSGRARFDVRPRGPRAWRIDCGAFSVEVVGTKFVLARSAEGLHVSVLHGAVLVRGEGIPDGVQRLNAGQTLYARPPQLRAAASAGALAPAARPVLLPLTTVVADSAADSVGTDSAQETQPVLPTPRTRRRHQRRAAVSTAGDRAAVSAAGDRAAVSAAGHRAAGERAAVSTAGDSVDTLFREADKARLEGRLDDAVVALRRILERHADDSRAALAGFALGRLQLTALHRPDLAARHFQLALSLGLPAALSEDAYAKLAEAHEKAGNHAAACGTWNEYARRYPQAIKRGAAPVHCELDSAR